jgi:hypothetical protein
MSGLFTFGWAGSVLVSVMTEFGKLDRARAKGPTDRGPSEGLTPNNDHGSAKLD